jgi:hypothetical protein
VTALVRLYPRAWRDRYEQELLTLLEVRPPTSRDRLDLIRGALDARLNPEIPGSAHGAEARRRVPVAVALAALAGVSWLAWVGVGLSAFRGWDGPMPTNAAATAVLSALASLLTAAAHVALALLAGDRLRPIGGLAVSIAAVCFLGIAVGAGSLGTVALLASAVTAVNLGRGTLPTWLARVWAVGAVVTGGSMVAFVASSGREVWMLGFVVSYGLVWLAIAGTLSIRGVPVTAVVEAPAPGPSSD